MNELIIQKNDNLSLLNPEISSKIAEFEQKIKELKEQEDVLKEAIKAEMETRGIIKLEDDNMIISYVAPTDRETFDSKAFKAEMPNLYDSFVKISPVKSSIRIKLR